MAEITAAAVKDLRDKTGAGMMDCKNALVESNGDEEKASALLRKKGIASASKKLLGQLTRDASRPIFIPEVKLACWLK